MNKPLDDEDEENFNDEETEAIDGGQNGLLDKSM